VDDSRAAGPGEETSHENNYKAGANQTLAVSKLECGKTCVMRRVRSARIRASLWL
jgi:hypothetical protein